MPLSLPLLHVSFALAILISAPSAWAPEASRILPPWVEESLDLLQKGGQARTDAEKAKIADSNCRLVAEKR